MTLRRGWVPQPAVHTSEYLPPVPLVSIYRTIRSARIPTNRHNLQAIQLAAGVGVPTRVGQWARQPRPYDTDLSAKDRHASHKCQHALATCVILIEPVFGIYSQSQRYAAVAASASTRSTSCSQVPSILTPYSLRPPVASIPVR